MKFVKIFLNSNFKQWIEGKYQDICEVKSPSTDGARRNKIARCRYFKWVLQKYLKSMGNCYKKELSQMSGDQCVIIGLG
jgi:hypothetical protein